VRRYACFFFFFVFTLVTGPRRSLSLKLSDKRVHEPQIRARDELLRCPCQIIDGNFSYKSVSNCAPGFPESGKIWEVERTKSCVSPVSYERGTPLALSEDDVSFRGAEKGCTHRSTLAHKGAHTLFKPRNETSRWESLFFFFPLVTGPSRSLSLKLSDTRVYEPQMRAFGKCYI